jgi:hypothetical protein
VLVVLEAVVEVGVGADALVLVVLAAVVAVGVGTGTGASGVDSGATVLVDSVLVMLAETVGIGSFDSVQAVMRSATISKVAVASLLVMEFLVHDAYELNDFAICSLVATMFLLVMTMFVIH